LLTHADNEMTTIKRVPELPTSPQANSPAGNIDFGFHIQAMAWAKPSQGQAVSDSFGLAWVLRKPKPTQAGPKPWLLGQAKLAQH